MDSPYYKDDHGMCKLEEVKGVLRSTCPIDQMVILLEKRGYIFN